MKVGNRYMLGVRFFKDAQYTPKNHVPKIDQSTIFHYYHTEPVENGRFVVVPAGDGYRSYGPFSIGIVCELDDDARAWAGKKLKNVIDVIDDTEMRRQQRVAELQERLNERAQQMDEMYRYKILADVDPDAKAMLEEMQGLTGINILPTLPAPPAPEPMTERDVEVPAPQPGRSSAAKRRRP